jgi:3-hydroxyacyl-CoA dehydrogenase
MTLSTNRYLIRKVGVLGAGNMGSRIAAHLANAGFPVVLLDIISPATALDALKKLKPAAFFDVSAARLITCGTFENNLELLRDCDWVIEVVAENLEIKRALLDKVAPHLRADAIVTTNTSGLPVAQIAQEMPAGFRRRWFGTHFFNPPRYMRLLEMIPTPEADPAAIDAIRQLVDKRLGKTVVMAKDTPNFIGNRIGTFAMMNAVRVMQALDMSIEEVDALTGSILGWPKMGTFRLTDFVGVDVLAHVAQNFFERAKDERSDLTLAPFLTEMVKRQWLGDKVGQGFYKKVGDDRLGLDWKTLEYRPSERVKFPLLEMAKNAESVGERLKILLAADAKKDRAAAFYQQVLPELWSYAAHRIPEIADDFVAIDRAMKAGFNWELGPFEMSDAAGLTNYYTDHIAPPEGVSSVAIFKKSNGVVKKNAGASLVDLGDGVGCIEFHSKMNAIGTDIVSFVTQNLKPGSDAVANFEAFVIASDGANFSVGANLMQMLLAMQEQEWDELDVAISSFQRMTQAVKFCPRPVVAAPFAMCLGGGAEISLHAAARQPHAELYIGLVEAGVGLIPGGGGCKEMLLRSPETESLRRAFENIAMAKVSTSAAEALSMDYLCAGDQVSMNRDRLVNDAKVRARELADAGYSAPLPRTDIPAPGENVLATLKVGVRLMREGEFISDHDVKVANHIAHILCGGKITPGTLISEQYLLDLERQAFLSLCGEKKTAERIAYTLKTGKPLRN